MKTSNAVSGSLRLSRRGAVLATTDDIRRPYVYGCVRALAHEVEQHPQSAHFSQLPYARAEPSTHHLSGTRPTSHTILSLLIFLRAVHVPKAAGHSVEGALWDAFHKGENRSKSTYACAKDKTCDTGDNEYFRGGHHTFFERVVHPPHGYFKVKGVYATLLREVMPRLISHYNDIHGYLSAPNTCTDAAGRPMAFPSYCGAAYAHVCSPGTGWNAVQRGRENFNGSSPCVPRHSFPEWVVRCPRGSSAANAHQCAEMNLQCHYASPIGVDRSESGHAAESEEKFKDAFRLMYLAVGTMDGRTAVERLTERLVWAVNAPHREAAMPEHANAAPSTRRRAEEVTTAAPPDASLSATVANTSGHAGGRSPTSHPAAFAPVPSSGFVPFRMAQLSDDEQARLVERTMSLNWQDAALYNAGKAISREQECCYKLATGGAHDRAISCKRE